MDEPFGAVDPIVRAQLQQRVPAAPERAAQDDRVRHPRHRRGRPARRPDRRAQRRRVDRAVRPPRRDAGPPGQRLRRRLPRQRPRPEAAVAAARRSEVGAWHPVEVQRLAAPHRRRRPPDRLGQRPRAAADPRHDRHRTDRPAGTSSTRRCRRPRGAPCGSTTTARVVGVVRYETIGKLLAERLQGAAP